VLVLSTAVLVIVIDFSMIHRSPPGDTVEFHRHSSWRRDDPMRYLDRLGVLQLEPETRLYT
jgi:hypothetical protein